jgi:hypothetical protein
MPFTNRTIFQDCTKKRILSQNGILGTIMPVPKETPVPFRFWKTQQRKTVLQDWCAKLPSEKLQVFNYFVAQTKPAHTMFSVALDDALMLRRSGKLELARDQAEVSRDLCERFAAALECLLDIVERHANHFGLLPSVESLDPMNFHGETAKRRATVNSLLSDVLFGARKRFLHKVKTLGEITSESADEYSAMTAEVSGRRASKEDWDRLNRLQYDLTTVLGEATVMLKSFLFSLPSGQVISFGRRLATALTAMQARPKRKTQRTSLANSPVPDRRAPAFRRE